MSQTDPDPSASSAHASNVQGRIRVGVGGWTYEPWRNNFYPAGLAHGKELAWASRRLQTIEVNGTYYSSFKPETFAKWRDQTPDDFVFSLKAHRFATTRKQLATAGDAIARFLGSGITELGPKLGPILWQFMPTRVFEPDDLQAFLALLPHQLDGRAIRHVLDVRHPSFDSPEYLALTARYGCVTVHTDAPDLPNIRDADAPFAYLRLMRSQPELASGYEPAHLLQWASGAHAWATGKRPRDAFIYFINGAKERAPAAAMALIESMAAGRPNACRSSNAQAAIP